MTKINLAAVLVLLSVLSSCQAQTVSETTLHVTNPAKGAVQLEPSKAMHAALVCPGKNFASFLQAFAADDQVRDRFTAPEVLVTDWRNPNETQEGTQVTRVKKTEYRDFTLRFKQGAFHNIDADGSMDPSPESIKVIQEGKNYKVSYAYGMSEGNSWRFVAKDDCWILAEDPEPSDP